MKNIKGYIEHLMESEGLPPEREYVLLDSNVNGPAGGLARPKMTNISQKLYRRVSYIMEGKEADPREGSGPGWWVGLPRGHGGNMVSFHTKTDVDFVLSSGEVDKRPWLLRFELFPAVRIRHEVMNLDMISATGGIPYSAPLPFSVTGVYDLLTGSTNDDAELLSDILLDAAGKAFCLIGSGVLAQDLPSETIDSTGLHRILQNAKKRHRARGAFGRF
jgi:hypothetical protein